ncbi:MAG: putative Ig domain-containing protein [Proteobacteria bacterium]|nr:putative Ig domain-containing protein [Pseudomonadota bacterium]
MSESFLQTTAKSKLYIGPANNLIKTLDEFEAIAEADWTEVTGLIDLGKWGYEGNEITQGFIDDAYVHRLKGNLDNGKIDLVVGRNPFDDGQNILRDAVQTNWNKYPIKVVLNDKPTETGTASVFYFKGVPLSAQNDFGEVNNVVKTTFSIGVDGQLFEVPADVTIVFDPAGPALTAGVQGTAYSETIAATGGSGTPTYSISDGQLPAGLSLNASTGVIGGTPSATGVSTFTVKVTYSGFGDDEHAYSVMVSAS